MSFIKRNWVALVAVCTFAVFFLLAVAYMQLRASTAQLSGQVKAMQANIAALNTLGTEIVNMAQGGSIASSTDFVKAVYLTDVAIQQQIQLQQQQTTPPAPTK